VEKHHFVFNSLLLITLIAFLVPLVLDRFRRIRIPFVVGEILAGVLVGKSGFNLIEVGPYLDFISTFGLTYLMFLSGNQGIVRPRSDVHWSGTADWG